jgi:hypothetical protein
MSGRPMKYPYTFAAKIAQFPWKFHINNNWMFRYYLIAVGITMPLFIKIGKMCKYSFCIYLLPLFNKYYDIFRFPEGRL